MDSTDKIARVHNWDLKDKYLRLKKKKIKKLIQLPPKYLGNLSKGIEQAIFRSNEETFKEFNGVPISMGKTHLLQNVATSIDDHPFLQFWIDLECVIFTPKVGKKVKAVVNKIGETYIGCLICERINASIFINDKVGSQPVKEGAKKSDGEETATDGEETGESKQIQSEDLQNLDIGQEILIKIKTIKYEQNNDLFIIASFVKSL